MVESATARFLGQRLDEACRLVDREHPAPGADPVRQIEGRETGTAAEIEQTRVRPEPGAVPEIVRRLGPQAVLRLEPPCFVGVGTEKIRLVLRASGVSQASHAVTSQTRPMLAAVAGWAPVGTGPVLPRENSIRRPVSHFEAGSSAPRPSNAGAG